MDKYSFMTYKKCKLYYAYTIPVAQLQLDNILKINRKVYQSAKYVKSLNLKLKYNIISV